MVNTKKLLEKLTAAKQEILEAERDLERLLQDIQVVPRSEKMVITEAIEEAFTRIKTARTFLFELEDLVEADKE